MRYQIKNAMTGFIIMDNETNSIYPLLEFSNLTLICKLLNDYDKLMKNSKEIEFEETFSNPIKTKKVIKQKKNE